jgi:predicted esterase
LHGGSGALPPMIAKVEAKASASEVDPLDDIKRQKIYLFHGYNDAVVTKSVTDAAAEFYRRYLANAGQGNLYYQESRGAGHSFVVNAQAQQDLNQAPMTNSLVPLSK